MATPQQGDPGRRPRRRRRRDRSGPVIGVLATLLALWLGLTAPSVSPVAPGPSPQQAVPVAGGRG